VDTGRTLRRARRRAGLSQRALATATGVAQPTIARIERGSESPRIDTLARLLRACGHRLEARPAAGDGVDRTAIRRLLALTPAERAVLATTEGRAMADVPVGVLAERRRSSR
jgi:transcriptional regulator with XRE-family HTH domain